MFRQKMSKKCPKNGQNCPKNVQKMDVSGTDVSGTLTKLKKTWTFRVQLDVSGTDVLGTRTVVKFDYLQIE